MYYPSKACSVFMQLGSVSLLPKKLELYVLSCLLECWSFLQISCMGTSSWLYTRDNLWLVFIQQEAGKLLIHLVKGCDRLSRKIDVSQKVVVTKFHMSRLNNIRS